MGITHFNRCTRVNTQLTSALCSLVQIMKRLSNWILETRRPRVRSRSSSRSVSDPVRQTRVRAVRSVRDRCLVPGAGIERREERERCRADNSRSLTAEETASSHGEGHRETLFFIFIVWLIELLNTVSVRFRETLTLKKASTRRRWSVTRGEWRRMRRTRCCLLTEPWPTSNSTGDIPQKCARCLVQCGGWCITSAYQMTF